MGQCVQYSKIGVLGLIGAGKDTFAEFLLKHLDGNYITDKYARPLKELTCRIYGCSMEDLEDRKFKETPKQVSRDSMVEEVFFTLDTVLKFTEEEMDTAADLFFENFSSARALSPREFQQVFGTDVVRATRKSAWCDYLLNKPENILVTDVRFENELCDFNILVTRQPNIPRPAHSSEHLAWDLEKHPTERPPNLLVLKNTGTLEDLERMAKYVAHKLNNN